MVKWWNSLVIQSYFDKYRKLLKPKNQNRVQQLLNILKAIHNVFNQASSKVFSISELQRILSLENVNLYDVETFIKCSELDKKVNGFIDKQKTNIFERVNPGAIVHATTGFLLTLMNLDKDGKMLLHVDKENPSKSSMKFLLLNPSVYFKEFLDKCRSVILAGGTMSPLNFYQQQLIPFDFTSTVANKMTDSGMLDFSIYQYEHIIPKEKLIAVILSRGPTLVEFDFSFHCRMDREILDEFGRVIIQLSKLIPFGLIVFFQSYSYEQHVLEYLERSGVLSVIMKEKSVFRECRDSNLVEELLDRYRKHIDGGNGALLTCVVGGKLSEGINFSDNYGRGVVMVGLPFPNPSSLELKEKMQYLNRLSPNLHHAGGAEYYENLCMKAVNQSIGRIIRHSKDYGTIVLLGARFKQMKTKLPNWIQKSLTIHEDDCASAFGIIKEFYKF